MMQDIFEGHVDEVIILETSTSGDSAGSILLVLKRNEDNSDWLNYVGIKPGSYLQQNEVRRHYNKTQTERNLCSRGGQKWFCRGPMVPGQSESTDMGKESRNHVFPQDKTCLSQHKWIQLADVTTSPTPSRYQVCGISLKLTPDKDD
jgi:hypothetical protein